ncbi:MAG TPA: phytanoyl-CoA dioxygenase family protein [Planctomycetota bacterium]|nr:phytanoyl-CoA dioxygenase family protein [Planctomycetota bacterium]
MKQGCEILERIFSPSSCDALTASLPVSRSRAGRRHRLAEGAVAAVAGSKRLLALARRQVGPGAVPFRATVFEKSGERNWLVAWHQDTTLPVRQKIDSPDWGPWSVKEGILFGHAPTWALQRVVALRIHLDASTADNGPLRVLPGTHERGVLADEEVFRLAKSIPAVELPVPRGGVLAMRPLPIHASSKSRTVAPRRVLHVEYAAGLDLAPGVRLALA